MSRSSNDSLLGWISIAGLTLGIAAWLLIGPREPKQNQTETPESAAPTQASRIPTDQPVEPLPTKPVFNFSESPLGDSDASLGSKAPDFALEDPAGKIYTLSELRGNIVVINFWASWCQPCREEMPDLQSLADTYADQGLIVLGVNSTYVDNRTDALEFVDELELTFPILFDVDGKVTEDGYGVFGLPITFWVDRDGLIRFIKIGPASEDELIETFQSIQAQSTSPENTDRTD